MEAQAAILRNAAELANLGALRPHVGREIALEEAPGAIADIKDGHSTGKTVVRMR